MNYEGLYLIREREFVRVNENIYKLGKSQHVLSRVKSYPKESILHLIILCKKSDEYEKDLIKILTMKFKLASRYGAEYFEGKLNKIILEIETFMKNKECIVCKVDNIMTHTINVNFINNKKVIKTIYPINKDEYENNIDSEVSENNNDEDSADIKDDKIVLVNLLDNYKGKRISHTCKICNYETYVKSRYDRHIKSQKHKNNILKNDINCVKIDKIDILIKQNEELMKEIQKLKDVNI